MNYAVFEKICKKNGTTPTALSQKLGLSKGNTTSWKKGGNPSIEVLLKLMKELNCSADELISTNSLDIERGVNENNNVPVNERENELLNCYRKLNDFDKGEILGDIKRRVANINDK